MESEVNERSEAGKQQKIKRIAGLFFGILLIFTFFSNTWLSLTLPKVLTVQAAQGSLSHTIEGSGILEPLEAVELTSFTAWKVETIHVNKGDSIVKGQALITLDSKASELQLMNEQTALKQQKLQLEGLLDSYVEASKSGDFLLIKAAGRQVDMQKLTIEAHERSIQALQEDLQSNRQLLAPFAGTVTQIHATEGVASPTINLSNTSKGFSLAVTLDADQASLLSIGERLQVKVKGKKENETEQEIKTIQGEITAIEEDQSAEALSTRSVRIELQDESLKGGESGSIDLRITFPTDKDTLLVPKSALHEDQSGTYVYVIVERKGTLGNGFYVHRADVKVVDSNENQAAVQGGIFMTQQVIMESSEPLQEGERVRL